MKLLPTLLLAGAFLSLSDAATAQTTTKKPAASPGATPAKTTAKPAAKPAAKPTTTTKPPTATATPPPKPAAAHSEAGPAPSPRPTLSSSTSSASSSSHSGGMGLSGNNDAFGKGTTAVNLGIGFGISYGYLSGTSSMPSISLAVDHGFIEGVGPGIISIGGIVGYKSASYDYNGYLDGKTARWTNLFIAARGAYHYNFTSNPRLNTYGGVMLGVRSYSHRWYGYDFWTLDNEIKEYTDTQMYLAFGLFAGARYYFTDNIGAFAELGYDVSFLKLGVSAKF